MKPSALLPALATAVLADPYNLGVWVREKGELVDSQRIWYGDGEVLVGPAVPPEVKVAFNISFTGRRSLLLDIAPDPPAASSSLPSPTFLAIHAAQGSAAPFFFAHSALNLTSDDVYLWAMGDGVMYPQVRAPSGTHSQSPAGGAFLGPTSVNGTYRLLWVVDKADVKGMKEATLNSRGRY